jgi:hypothetical protein
MERKNVCIALVTVMLLSTSFIAGCTDPFYRKGSCPQCGCHYSGTRFQPGDEARLTITGPDIPHGSEFAKTPFRLSTGRLQYELQPSSVIPATNTTPQTIIYEIVFSGPTDTSGYVKIAERVWTDYTIGIYAETQDAYIKNRTFFNGSNNIKGKLWNDQGGEVLNMTVEPAIQGISINATDRGRDFLQINTTEWAFEIEARNGMICID